MPPPLPDLPCIVISTYGIMAACVPCRKPSWRQCGEQSACGNAGQGRDAHLRSHSPFSTEVSHPSYSPTHSPARSNRSSTTSLIMSKPRTPTRHLRGGPLQ
jgi:hypothetical protein